MEAQVQSLRSSHEGEIRCSKNAGQRVKEKHGWQHKSKRWIWSNCNSLLVGRREWKMVKPLWKTVWQLLTKFNIPLPYGPEVLLLDIFPREKIHTQKNLYKKVHSSFMHKFLKNPKNKPGKKKLNVYLTGKWINKLWYIYIMENTQQSKTMNW